MAASDSELLREVIATLRTVSTCIAEHDGRIADLERCGQSSGIIGRYVMALVTKPPNELGISIEIEEPCEVVACDYAAEGGYRLLVVSRAGDLLSIACNAAHRVRLAPTPNEGSPHR